jgi:HEAT repeat protein
MLARRFAVLPALALIFVGTNGFSSLQPIVRADDDDDEPKVRDIKLSDWLKILRDRASKQADDVKKRRAALLAMSIFGPEIRDVVEEVLATLKDDESPIIRGEAANVLGRMGPAIRKKGGYEVLTDRLLLEKEKDAGVRELIAHALGEIAKAIKDRRGPDENRMVDQLVVDALSDTLKHDKSEKVRKACAQALARCGEDAAPAVANLAEALRDKDADVRMAAAEALGRVGQRAAPAVERLSEALKDDNRFTRSFAAFALGRIGAQAKPVVPKLAEALLTDKQPEVRRTVAEALGKIGADAKDGVAALAQVLGDENVNDDVRRAAAVALGQIGVEAREALPTLRNACQRTKERDKFVRSHAIHALGKFGKEEVATLVECLKDDVAEVRLAAIAELNRLGKEAKDAIPALEETKTKDNSGVVREAAADALTRIKGEEAPKQPSEQ